MTHYRVAVSRELLPAADWSRLLGVRLVSVDGPWPRDPQVWICTLEDDHAPARFEGRLVDLDVKETEDGMLAIAGITEIPYPGPLPAPSGV